MAKKKVAIKNDDEKVVKNNEEVKNFIVSTKKGGKLNVRNSDNEIVKTLTNGSKVKGEITDNDLIKIADNEFIKKSLVKEEDDGN